MSRITKNLQNIGGGSLTLGTSPAVANINMANNSLSNVNQINGQIFPPGPGSAGHYMTLSGDGKTMYWVSGLGAVGATGVTGPQGPVGGATGQILYNDGGYPSAAGSTYLTFDPDLGLTRMQTASVVDNFNVGGNISGNFGCNSYRIANVTLSSGTLSNANSTSNRIGGWTLSSSFLCNVNFSVQSTGHISNANSTSNRIGGITLSSGTISNAGTTSNSIGGWVISNSLLSNANTSIASDGTITTPGGVSNQIGAVTLANGTIIAPSNTSIIAGTYFSNYAFGVGVTPGAYALNISGTGFVSETFNVSGELTAHGTLTVQGETLSAGSAVATLSSAIIRNSLSAGSLTVTGTATIATIVGLTLLNGTNVNISSSRETVAIGNDAASLNTGFTVNALGVNAA